VALSMAQMSNVARHLRYPVLGMFTINVAGQSLATATAVSYRYTQAYGMLLWRLNNLTPNEEARITGMAYGSLVFVGPTPNVGDVSYITFSGGGLSSPVTIELVATEELIAIAQPKGIVQKTLVSQYFNANIGLGLASQVAFLVATNPALTQAGFVARAPYGTGPYRQQAIPVPEVDFTNQLPFSISVQNTGNMSVQIDANGSYLSPSISPNSLNSPLYGYLPILDFLETAYGNSTDILQIDRADVFTARKTVLAETLSLYQTWAQRLSEFMDVPLNPFRKGDFGRSSMRNYL